MTRHGEDADLPVTHGDHVAVGEDLVDLAVRRVLRQRGLFGRQGHDARVGERGQAAHVVRVAVGQDHRPHVRREDVLLCQPCTHLFLAPARVEEDRPLGGAKEVAAGEEVYQGRDRTVDPPVFQGLHVRTPLDEEKAQRQARNAHGRFG